MEHHQPFQQKVFFPNPCYRVKGRTHSSHLDTNVVTLDRSEMMEPDEKRIRLGEAPEVHLDIVKDFNHNRQLKQSQLPCPHTNSISSTNEIAELHSSVHKVMEEVSVIVEEAKTFIRHGGRDRKRTSPNRELPNTTKRNPKEAYFAKPKTMALIKPKTMELLKPKLQTGEFPQSKRRVDELPHSKPEELSKLQKLGQRRKRESEFGNLDELSNQPRIFKPARRLLEHEIEPMDCD